MKVKMRVILEMAIEEGDQLERCRRQRDNVR